MLNIILKKAYDRLDYNIYDLCRYVNIDDIVIRYHDYGTTDADTFKPGRVTLANINTQTKEIDVNEFMSKRYFLLTKKYKDKFYREQAIFYYEEAIKVIEHELLHLYLHEKFNEIACDYDMTNYLYKDHNPIFVICCLILGIEHNHCEELEEFNGLFDEFAERYRILYGHDLYEFLHMLRLLFIDRNEFTAFNYYTLWSSEDYEKLTDHQVEVIEMLGNMIVKRIDIWMEMLEIDLRKKANKEAKRRIKRGK